jgi:hypothetical protein
MPKRRQDLCKNCKFCARLFDYERESSLLFCDNALTKEAGHPIGFLSHDDVGCEFFEGAQEEKAQYISAALSHELLNTAG